MHKKQYPVLEQYDRIKGAESP